MIQTLRINTLEINKGQIEGLPKNPRFIKDERFKALVKSIEDAPEMLSLRELLVYPHGDKYVVIGGNMRLRACKELGYKEIPCKVLPIETPVKKLREYTIKDNNSFGQTDWDLIETEWNIDELSDWGLECDFDAQEPDVFAESSNDINADDEDSQVSQDDKIDEAELLLDKAMQQYLLEQIEQIDILEKANMPIISGLTEGFAKIKFIKSKFYNKKYPRYCSIIFNPHQLKTSVNTRSIYEQMIISGREGKAGIAGFRTLSSGKSDNLIEVIKSSSYPIGSARMPLDFPVELARELISKFCKKGGDVLDPCHGWGGRLTAAMLEDVGSYTGVDPSSKANAGAERIKTAFMPYTNCKNINIINSPFEELELKKDSFDFAMTSPPYFDVEQYEGENTSTAKYSNYKLWVEKFYRVLIENTHNALRKNCVFALIVGSQKYPLREDAIKIAKGVGFDTSIFKENALPSNKSKLHETENERGETVIILKKI